MTRDGARQRRTRGAIKQVPWRRYRNPYKPIEVLSADQIESIHESSLKVLEEIGMDFLDEESLAILKSAGAEVAPIREAAGARPRVDDMHMGGQRGESPRECMTYMT